MPETIPLINLQSLLIERDEMNAGVASWKDIEKRINGEAGKRTK